MFIKIIVGAIIFMIPILTNAIISLVDSGKVSNSYLSCYKNATLEKIKEYKAKEEAEMKTEAEAKENERKANAQKYENQQSEIDKNNNIISNDNQSGAGNGIISGNLEVHFINSNSRVDSIYIKSGDKSIFIDGGFKNDSVKEIMYLDSIGVTHIDYYIGTHSHLDHVEAAPAIIAKYGIKNVIVGRETCSGSNGSYCTWYAIKVFADQQKVNLSDVSVKSFVPGDSFTLHGMKVTCVGPMKVNNNLARGDGAQNYNSLMFRLDYGSKSFMMTGDNSSSSVIKDSYAKYSNLMQVDVLKNPHHNGNIGSNSYKIFNAKYVVFTTSSKSLPSSSCLDAVRNAGSEYLIVADGKNGNVVFSTDGNTLNVKSNYNP